MYRRRSRSRTWDICRVKRRFETDHRPVTREQERPDADPWTSQKDPIQRLHSNNWDWVRGSSTAGQSTASQSSAGQSTAGQSTAGQSTAGQSTALQRASLQQASLQRASLQRASLQRASLQRGRPGLCVYSSNQRCDGGRRRWCGSSWGLDPDSGLWQPGGLRYVAGHSEKDEGGTGDSDDLLLDQFMVGLRRGLVKQELSRQLRRRDGTTFKAACTEARALEQELQAEEESLVTNRVTTYGSNGADTLVDGRRVTCVVSSCPTLRGSQHTLQRHHCFLLPLVLPHWLEYQGKGCRARVIKAQTGKEERKATLRHSSTVHRETNLPELRPLWTYAALLPTKTHSKAPGFLSTPAAEGQAVGTAILEPITPATETHEAANTGLGQKTVLVGSQVSMMSLSLFKKHMEGTQVQSADEVSWLTLRAANGLQIPYIGYVTVNCLGNHPGLAAFKTTVTSAEGKAWGKAEEGVANDPEKTEAVKEWPIPQTEEAPEVGSGSPEHHPQQPLSNCWLPRVTVTGTIQPFEPPRDIQVAAPPGLPEQPPPLGLRAGQLYSGPVYCGAVYSSTAGQSTAGQSTAGQSTAGQSTALQRASLQRASLQRASLQRASLQRASLLRGSLQLYSGPVYSGPVYSGPVYSGPVYCGAVYSSTASQSTAGQSTARQREIGKRPKYNAATTTCESIPRIPTPHPPAQIWTAGPDRRMFI
uniref:Uncharacterized protein n=1 Tax=Knipowitschia caucasica TaxID=637954 RepID=A0AAV2K9S7_KNICA